MARLLIRVAAVALAVVAVSADFQPSSPTFKQAYPLAATESVFAYSRISPASPTPHDSDHPHGPIHEREMIEIQVFHQLFRRSQALILIHEMLMRIDHLPHEVRLHWFKWESVHARF